MKSRGANRPRIKGTTQRPRLSSTEVSPGGKPPAVSESGVRPGYLYPILLLLAATFIVYIPAMQSGFIWNDDTFLTRNALIRAGDGLYRFWATREAPDYWPLTSSTLWVEWRLWGMHATGYHVTNVFLHALSSILLWLVLRRLKVPGPLLGALLFAVHPVCVESVAWITERKNNLTMVFYLLTFLFYLKSEDTGEGKWRHCSIVSFLLALLSKTAVVMTPVILLAMIWWKKATVRRQDLVRLAPFFLLSLVFGLVTIWFQYAVAIGSEVVRDDSFLSRLAISGMAVWFYLGKALFPWGLNFVYPRWVVDTSSVFSFIPLILIAVLFLVLWAKRDTWGRGPLFTALYYVLALFPILGFFNDYFMRYSFVADHWQYFAIPGVLAFEAAIVTNYAARLKLPDSFRLLPAGGLVLIFIALTWNQSLIYKDEETLYRGILKANAGAWIAHVNLANIYSARNRYNEALAETREALRLNPICREGLNNLGRLLIKTNRAEEAIEYFNSALPAVEKVPEAHLYLGLALKSKKRFEEAQKHFERALELRPNWPVALNDLGVLYASTERFDKAREAFLSALKADPNFSDAYNSMGVLDLTDGNMGEAERHFREALRLNPQSEEAKRNLSLVIRKR